jgi:hypothetical protein
MRERRPQLQRGVFYGFVLLGRETLERADLEELDGLCSRGRPAVVASA